MLYLNWIVKWLQRKEQLVKESTFAAYSNIVVNHLLPKFGEMKLEQISEEVIQDYVFELLKHGRLDGSGGLGERAAKDIVIVLKNTLRDAMRAKLIKTTVFEIRFPSFNSQYKVKVLSPSEQKLLCDAIDSNLTTRSAGIFLSLHTGMRIGEVCALRWMDVDMDDRMIHINHTLQRVYKKDLSGSGKSKLLLSTPKTKTSRRSIPISKSLFAVMKELSPSCPDMFFLSGSEKMVEVRTFRTFFEAFLMRNGIEKFNFHVLRHTFATRCIEAGADCKTVSELLGHATVNMTLNLYVHPRVEQKRNCVELI